MFFWFPNLKDEKYEGYWFPHLGESREQISVTTKISNKCRINGIEVGIEDMKQYFTVAESLYKDNTFIFFTNILHPNGEMTQQSGNNIGFTKF
jgi:hypothetical protein